MSVQALTWLQIINRILSRLRESTVAANNTNDYSTLVGALVNQVKTEIEKAYYWNSMRDTYSVSATVGNTNYILTSSGMNAIIIDGWNITTPMKLVRGTNADFNAKFFGVAAVQTGSVEQYLPAGYSVNYDLTVDVWPSPSASQSLKFTVYRPQNDLAADGDIPLCPQEVLIEETIARLLVERGDEGADKPQPGESFIRKDLLQTAVSIDGGMDEEETDWIVT